MALPLSMLWINGSKALHGIIWTKNEVAQTPAESEKIIYHTLDFGIYDPYNNWNDSLLQWDYKQYYLNWLYFEPDLFAKHIDSTSNHERIILIAEPWAKNENDLFTDITKGVYDKEIKKLDHLLDMINDTVYLSWGHEMDQDLTARYSWSSPDSTGFINAYKYVYNKITNEKVKWIWAPVGKHTCNRYYPGDKFVDIISLPIYAFPQFDFEYYGHIRSFSESFSEKYELIKHHKKPVYLTEFGIHGSYDFESFWLEHSFQSFNLFPLLKTIVFFNSKDTEGAWGKDYNTPDWSVNQEQVSVLVNQYRHNF